LLKRGLLLFSIILITVGVGLCGCMSSNGSGSSKTIGGLEKVEVANTQKVETTPLSNTVKIKTIRGDVIEIPKDDYEALKNDRVPEWYIKKVESNLNPPKEVIEKLKNEKLSDSGIAYIIPYSLGECCECIGYLYDSRRGEWRWDNGMMGDLGIYIVSNKTFDEFLLVNGINPYSLDKSKYNNY